MPAPWARFETDLGAHLMTQIGNGLHIEALAGEIVAVAQHDQRQFIAHCCYLFKDTSSSVMASCPGLGSSSTMASAGQSRGTGPASQLRTGPTGRRFFDDDLVARFRRAVKADHHQVQVDGEGIHCHHFGRLGAGYARQAVCDVGVVTYPGAPGFEVAFDGIFSPGVALLMQRLPCALRHEPQRVAGEVE